MTGFGWTRLAYLLVVLSVLGVLVQLGSPSADPRPLAAEPPETGETAGAPPDAAERPRVAESASSRASTPPRENSGPPAFARHLKRATAGGLAAAPDAGKAVFHRPPPPGSPADAEGAPGPGPVCGDLGRAPSGQRLVFPLPMRNANSYEDTWGAPRPQGGHEGTDLMVPTGTPEYAVTDGTLVPVAGSNGNGWNSLGGYAVMLRAAYSVGPVRAGDLFYYAHLEEESALPIGSTVRAGQVVGYAGDTGQGPEVTRGLFPPHLHFGWYDAGGGRSYLPSGAMNPFPLLEWVRSGGGVLGGGSDARYCEVPRSGAPIPSTGADRWPVTGNDGARPDLDTGKHDPAPSPVVAGNGPRAQERPADRPEPQNRAGKDPRQGSERTPDRDPRAPKPPPPDRAPGKPEPRDEPASPGPPAEQDPAEDPRAPTPSPDNEPPPGGGNPGGGQGNGEPGEDEDKPRPETPGDQDPKQDEPGKADDPEGPKEESEENPAPPEGEDAPDEDKNPESTVPEAGGSEDAEPAPEETTPE